MLNILFARPSGYWLAVLQRFLFGHCCLGDCHSRLGRLAQAPISMNLNLDEQPMNWAHNGCSTVTCSSDFSITFCLFAWQNGMMVACGVLLAITTMCCFCMNFRRPVLAMFELPTYFGLSGVFRVYSNFLSYLCAKGSSLWGPNSGLCSAFVGTSPVCRRRMMDWEAGVLDIFIKLVFKPYNS